MMTLRIEKEGTNLVVSPEGRLDTSTAPQFEKELTESLDGVTDLTFNMEKLDYISSVGLRVLLSTQKRMNRQGKMKVTRVNETVMEVFEVTGFLDILTVEPS